MNRAVSSLYRAKEWIERFATRPSALPALFVISFIEGAIFPIPPDVLFIALAVSRPRASFLFATVCVAGSTAGAMVGYLIGALFYDTIGATVVAFLGFTARFDAVLQMYHDNAWTTLLLAGFTNIPFAIFTLAAGFRRTLDPMTLFLGALAGRAVRFYALGLLLFYFGPAVKRFIDRWLPAVSLGLVALFLLTIYLLRR
jgi:membrane protein YqaA with SNARE-associated domain